MHLWYFWKLFLYANWSALRNLPGLCILPGEWRCASNCSHTVDKSQDTAEKYVAWQEWLFIHSSTVAQEVLVNVNVAEKNEVELLKLHPEEKTAKSRVFKLEKQTILLLSFPAID